MSKINVENVIKHLDFEKIEEEKKNGKNLNEILRGIDLKPIIREEMVKINPSVDDKEIDNIVKEIDLAKVLEEVTNTRKRAEELTGKSFEDLSEEDMRMLQGAGDVDVEITPAAITTSSYPCLAGVSAIASAALSVAKC